MRIRFLTIVVTLGVLLQAFAAMGAPYALVLCVGSAGHVAIEDESSASRCRTEQGGLATAGSEPGVTGSCVDTPLGGALAGSPASTVPLPHPAQMLAAPAYLSALDAQGALAVRPDRRPAVAPGLGRILRATVLLI
jgi:hypothetical protein